MRKSDYEILPLAPSHREWANRLIDEHWASTEIYSRWRPRDTTKLPGFVAAMDNELVGLTTYVIEGEEAELVSLNSLREGIGIGESLLYAVRDIARAAGCKRLWLTTSNDNLPALQFYQKRNMAIVAVHRFAIDEARKSKPRIPILGYNGIPCRDELELEMLL